MQPTTPRFEAGCADHQKEECVGVLKPPYNPILYVRKLQDGEEG